MRDIELIKDLRRIGKAFYDISDLEKVTMLKRESLYVSLARWSKRGVLERISKGLYILPDINPGIENIASQLCIPSYLSFESALSKYGVLNLVPYALIFATTRRTKKITLMNTLVEFRQIKADLFFGFELKEGIYMATPEKAFLDSLYLKMLGKSTLDIDELNLKILNKKIIFQYARRYPPYVIKYLKKVF